MAVLTISRELGSGGRTVARKAAEILGYRFADKKLLGEILGEYGLVEFPAEYEASRGFWDYFDARGEAMVEMLNRAILAVAATDEVVVLGRGCFALLRGFEDVVNARIQAPFGERSRRIAAREGLKDAERAEDLVRKADKTRRSFVEQAYGLRWNDSELFDLVIDTAKVDSETAASWLVEAVGLVEARPSEGGRRVSQIDVDPTLAEAVEEAFAKAEEA